MSWLMNKVFVGTQYYYRYNPFSPCRPSPLCLLDD